MIKTVSFAPPRSASSRSSNKPVGAKVVPAEALRPATRAASGSSDLKSSKAPAQTSLELLFDAPDDAPGQVAAPAASPVETKTAPKVKADVKAPAQVKAPVEVKAKRARVPKDFAAQYGEKVVERIAPPVEAEVAKKRLSKVERQARRELIKPSEGLLERLARVNQIVARKPKSEPRGKGWKFICGRCGTTSYFETPGGLCTCGTIALKE